MLRIAGRTHSHTLDNQPPILMVPQACVTAKKAYRGKQVSGGRNRDDYPEMLL
jgi:hypothetical protein